MIENMEESVLSAGHVLQVLNIIDNQSVDALVEMEKTVDIACGSCRILALEKSGRDIKYARTRITLFYAYAYSLYEVCLADTCRTKNKQRVESLGLSQ